MIRRWWKRSLCLLLTLAGIYSYYTGISCYSQLRHYPNTHQVSDVSLSKTDYDHIRETQAKEESSLEYALWGKTDGINVENPQFKRSFSVSMWKIRGNLDVVFGGFVKLQEQDARGCYLDAKTARELFGSEEVIGNEIVCQGKRWTIRGILRGGIPVLAVRPGELEFTDCITLQGGTDAEVKSFLLRYGISGTAVHGMFLREILQLLLLLFPISLSICFFRNLRGICGDEIRWGLLLLFFFLILRLVEIPETMIPDKWSNFQFWKNWWEAAKSNVEAFLGREKTGMELEWIICFLKGTAWALSAVLLGQAAFRIKNLWNREAMEGKDEAAQETKIL